MDTNFYPYPLPIIPIMDWAKKEIIRIDELATGGTNDPLEGKTHEAGVLDHCESAEYVPELLEGSLRKDLKALNVTQPDGPSFSVVDNQLIEWQKWRFRVSFNPREGAVIHDVYYDGRSVVYRLAFSEMVSNLQRVTLRFRNTDNTRPFHTQIQEHPSTANKLSTSVTAVSAIARTTYNSAAIA
jgi:Cu2+-containing amine oxidase